MPSIPKFNFWVKRGKRRPASDAPRRVRPQTVNAPRSRTPGDYVPATPATFLDLDAFDAEADAQAIADIVGVARDRDD
jgi:hypothetical protein